MKPILTLSFLFLFVAAINAQNDFKIVKEENAFYVVNKYGIRITELNEEFIDFKHIESEIKASGHLDSPLISRMLAFRKGDGRVYELVAMSKTYKFMDEILHKHIHNRLIEKYGKRKLKKFLKRKK